MLDYILSEVVNNNNQGINTKHLKNIPGGLGNIEDYKIKKYEYYVNILKEYPDYFEIVTTFGIKSTLIRPVNQSTIEFKETGGFQNLFLQQNNNTHIIEETKKLNFEKLQHETKLSRFSNNHKNFTFIISILSFIISFILLIIKIFEK